MNTDSEISQRPQRMIPAFFPTQSKMISAVPYEPALDAFRLFRSQFAHLVDWDLFQKIKPALVECDIQAELALMTEDSLLEVTVPVLGMVDLFSSSTLNSALPQIASVVAINGFGADKIKKEHHYPRADYVVVTDIVGNKFEIVVNAEGNIELPAEGTGLFSFISSMTFIYSAQQVKYGQGLTRIPEIQSGQLFLYPPTGATSDFSPKICVTHLDIHHQRIVDSIRTIAIKCVSSDRDLTTPEVGLDLVKTLYSEYHFTKACIEKTDLGFSIERGYNQFLLRMEAISLLYDLFVNAFVHSQIRSGFFFEQVTAKLADLKVETLYPQAQEWIERGNRIEEEYQAERRRLLKSKPAPWLEKDLEKKGNSGNKGKEEGPPLSYNDSMH